MRWTLISFLCIVAISNVMGQKHVLTSRIEGSGPINVGLEEVKKRFTPSSIKVELLKSGSFGNSNINITYVDFPENAKAAFEYAISIWEQHISTPVPIAILAKWENIQGNVLAHSRPATFYKNFDEAPLADVYYPIPLVEKLSGREWNGSKEADILCSFNKNMNWYFGTDGNTTVTSYDLVTVILHEIAHGLGISGFLAEENGMGKINNPANNPSVYDYYILNANNQRITDKTFFSSPSYELHDQLTSNNLNYGCEETDWNSTKSAIYAPSSWKNGISIYHLKSTQSNSNGIGELMSPYMYKGEANHDPGINTLNVLNEMGWNSNLIQFQELKDVEETATFIQIETKLSGNISIKDSTFQIIFSTDNFVTSNSIRFSYNANNQLFEASLPVSGYKGNVKYYLMAETVDNEVVTHPKQATENYLSFKIGPDYYTPDLKHNPSKIMLSSNPEISFFAIATDNLGIGSVKIEYRINGIAQEPFVLGKENNDVYKGILDIALNLSDDDVIEYRVVAEDNSARKNKKFLPSQGFYQVEVFEAYEPVSGYQTDFNTITGDFTITDFEINTPLGFNNGILHTNHPYPTSEIRNEKYDLIAQLNHPVILEENGIMEFDEVVLVEPGELGTKFTDELFWDYVIVEASKNGGESWYALVDGYDSNVNESWQSRFSETLKSNASSAAGHESMFWKQTINLTDNPTFAAGDTVVFRFRLSSDESINGWGWAIDNLKIQSISTGTEDLYAEKKISMYPNPCRRDLFIDCMEMSNSSSVEIKITDLYGKTVYQETKYDIQYEPKLKIDLSNVGNGMYLASITDSELNTITQKIIKN